jgi:TRAP-type C4-dicarboxylate transport system permease small subunit
VINKYDHPALAWVMGHWQLMIMMCGVLLLLAGLASITRWWQQKDEAARLTTYRRPYGY